ncbi:MAG TPA: SPOR domain-containing protein [Actinomycetes bacterium]|jgi:hypothetical protein|nr:SPOR domain-containing protein [Actinomycetes bacterium]
MAASNPTRSLAIVGLAVLLGLGIGILAAFIAGGERPPDQVAADTTVSTTPLASFWTVVLASIPTGSSGQQAAQEGAEARVEQLRRRGVAAEVLDSDRYTSLNKGFLVVFSGRFAEEGAARAHQRELRARGLDGYVRQARR